ncbi:hypothetical protein BC830DRAFT_1077396 [Chytriomyces sp. MP71]|nr:hypothetical protein BC830DRAFT_1077396 [Chytriomyces sp. MP71]
MAAPSTRFLVADSDAEPEGANALASSLGVESEERDSQPPNTEKKGKGGPPPHPTSALMKVKKKRALIESVDKVRGRINALEREIASYTSKSSLKNELGSLYAHSSIKADAERLGHDEQILSSQIRKIKDTVASLLGYLKKSEPGSTSLRIVRQTMDSVEQDITGFRSSARERMDILFLDEKKLAQEILLVSERVTDQLDSSPELMDEVARVSTENLTESEGVLSEVSTFQDYLVRHGGYNGGWDDLSHAAFLKLRQKYGANDARFFSSCVSSIPGVGFREVQEHEAWYRTFKDLLDAKKEAIRLWKERKRAAAIRMAQEQEKEKENVSENHERRKLMDCAARQKAKEDLLIWKEKQQEAALQKKREKQEDRYREFIEQEKRRLKNERLKDRVSEYTKQRLDQEALQKQLLEEARHIQKQVEGKFIKQELERLKQRDDEILTQKRQREQEKQTLELEKELRLQKLRAQVEVSVKRDPTRILKPTKGYENKMAALDDDVSGKKFSAPFIPKRHVPSWRRGV